MQRPPGKRGPGEVVAAERTRFLWPDVGFRRPTASPLSLFSFRLRLLLTENDRETTICKEAGRGRGEANREERTRPPSGHRLLQLLDAEIHRDNLIRWDYGHTNSRR